MDKVWCLHPRHEDPCPDADTCLDCVDECGAGYDADTSVQFMGTREGAVREMARRRAGLLDRFEEEA